MHLQESLALRFDLDSTFSPPSDGIFFDKIQEIMMPKGSKVAKVERRLEKEYPGNPGAVYGTLNKIGLMKGNKTTAKGKEKAKKGDKK